MWTMQELIEMETPYLTMHDVTDADWEKLDFELEKYDKANEDYPLHECKVLAFVLQQIHYNKMNFNEVPNFIRNRPNFQELVVKYNPELSNILFPTRMPKDKSGQGTGMSRFMITPNLGTFGKNRKKKIVLLNEFSFDLLPQKWLSIQKVIDDNGTEKVVFWYEL